MQPIQHILAPTDGSDHSLIATRYALELAKKFEAKVTLLMIVDKKDLDSIKMSTMSDELRHRAQAMVDEGRDHALSHVVDQIKDCGVPFSTAIEQGEPAKEIVSYAKAHAVDWIVMSTHARTGLAHFIIGSVTESVVQHSPCPVLSLPNPHSD